MFYRFHKLYQEYSQQNQQLQGIRYQRQIDSFQVYPPTRDYSNYLNHDPSISRDIAIIIDCQNKYYQKNCHQITTKKI